jgi:hypothetical protein
MKGKTVLILGAGNVGEACAALLTAYKPSKIILHALTVEDAERAKENVLKLGDFSNITLETSFGNILTTKSLLGYTNKSKISDLDKSDLLKYLYFPLADEIYSNSSLYGLLVKNRPDYIIDSINTSTAVGSARDIYSAPQLYLNQKELSDELIEDLLTSAIIPFLVRFVQVLHKYLDGNPQVEYVKVSTTGLGGMGMNIKYTHGDLNETGLSSGILGKIAAAGIMHQLLWNLAHTPGIKVKVVVPAALIGWQGAYYGKFRSNGKLCLFNKNVNKIKLNEDKISLLNIEEGNAEKSSFLEIPFADSGENDAYSLAEMTAITAQGQMEAITREEVAMAVIGCLTGSTRYDLISSMDMASLTSTFAGAVQRNIILDQLKAFQSEHNTPSIATNNLGPSVTKHLFELYFVLEAGDFNLEKIVSLSNEELQNIIGQLLLDKKDIVNQILSLGLPILQRDNIFTYGDKIIYPKNIEEQVITSEKIDCWANVGWIDLREKQIQYWVRLIKTMVNELNNTKNKLVNVERNLQNNYGINNLGEVLAYLYSLSGGNRRKY